MKPEPPPSQKPLATGGPLEWLKKIALWIVSNLLANFQTLFAAIWIGAAGLFLTVAWSVGPQRMVDAAHYAKFTGHVQGRIVESWLAVEMDIDSIRNPSNWRARAFASPCEVVEYQGAWSSTAPRRAFCGNRFQFNIDYTLADLRELAPGVPFGWSRDTSGFIVPEIRIDEEARKWLLAHPVTNAFMHENSPAKSAFEELWLELDLPVDAAAAGWIGPPEVVPLAFDPQHPDGALPTGVIESRLAFGPNWVVLLMAATAGLIGWLKGMTTLPLLSGMARPARWLFILLPLATLPWWGTYFPNALAHLNAQWASVVRDMFADIDPTGRFIASSREDATLVGGFRLVVDSSSSVYGDTFGRFKFAAPTPAPATADAALAALAVTITTQVRVLDETDRTALFSRLERDAKADLDHAGIVFFPAAKEAVLARRTDEGPAQAAHDFLRAWSNRQHLHGPQQLAPDERERLARAVDGLPWE